MSSSIGGVREGEDKGEARLRKAATGHVHSGVEARKGGGEDCGKQQLVRLLIDNNTSTACISCSRCPE